MSSAIHIGATRKATKSARKGVLKILKAGREEETTRKALEVYALVCEVKNVNITGCTINAGKK